MNDLLNIEMSKSTEAALLHDEIMRNGAEVVSAMVSLSKNLKKMRDSRLYLELGFDSFESYTEQAVGLKKSQAYDYINALEKLGEAELERSSALGITKIKYLCKLSPVQREEIKEEAEGMTVRELEEKIKQLTQKSEQLMLDLDGSKASEKSKETEIEELNAEIKDLKKALAAERNKPTEVAVRELTEEEKQQITYDAVKKAKKETEDQLKEKNKKLIKKFEDQSKAAAEALEKEKKKNEAEKANLLKQVEEAKKAAMTLEQKLKVSGDNNLEKFKLVFENINSATTQLFVFLGGIGDMTIKKQLAANLSSYADKLKDAADKIAK